MTQNHPYDSLYFEKTYSGWLGKIIGIRLGSPIEGWTYEKIRSEYGEITDYLVDYRDYAADDDSNGPLFFARALDDYAPETVTEKEMGLTWLNYVPERHGFFWWGGYGISTEHTAYDNMRMGIDPPVSGSIEQNGAACAEQIGGQIFSDCWGFLFPGNPVKAADYARKMARVSHDGEAVYGGMFVAACISAAYVSGNIDEVIEAGLSVIPSDSLLAGLCREVIEYHRKDAGRDWRGCMKFLIENYGYDKYPGNCHVVPNAGVIFLSLVYGGGDFSKTQCICNMCGWDTDCNAGNVGAIVGVLTGIGGIERKWVDPVNDLLIASSVLGGLNIDTVSRSAGMFCRTGCRAAGKEMPDSWKERLERKGSLIHFDMPGSTGSFRWASNDEGRVCRFTNGTEVARKGHRSLHLFSAGMKEGSEVQAYIKTYYKPEDLHDSRYDPAFTPVVFPGQKIRVTLYNAGAFPLEVRIRALDINNEKEYLSGPFSVKAEWTTLEYDLPAVEGGLIKELGIVVKPDAGYEGHSDLNLFLDEIRWDGTPFYTLDFGKESVEHFGYANGTLHREISQLTYHSGLWELDGSYLSGSASGSGEAYTGFYDTGDFAMSCFVRPQKGEFHLLNFRVQGAVRSYAFGFYGEGRAALVKKNREYRLLADAPFSYDMDREYLFEIVARGGRFELSIDGRLLMIWEDSEAPYLTGQAGFGVLEGSHCHYREFRMRPLKGEL